MKNLPETDKRETPPVVYWWELSLKCPCGGSGVHGWGELLVCPECNRAWDRKEVAQ